MNNESQMRLSNNALAMQQQQVKSSSPAAAVLQLQLERARQLLKDGTPAPAPAAVPVADQYLTFSLLDRDFAVKADAVQGVERLSVLTPVPNVASWIRGIMNLRGSIISVVDLRAFLGLESLPLNARTRLLSLQYNDMVICFMVDAISGMLAIPPSTIVSGSIRQSPIPQWIMPYARGMTLINNRAIILLDVAQLLFSEKIQHYEL